MRIIISPAKKMNRDVDSLPWQTLPRFLDRTKDILAALQSMSYEELKALWKCSDQIAKTNVRRLAEMELETGLTPAILAYEGIQYQYMAPGVFSDGEYAYVQERLRILSGFYGLLRPFDGVAPYRLEMQARLAVDGRKDLYGFWGDELAKALCAETDTIVNLASKEYSQAVSRYLPDHVRFVTCIFGEEKGGKVVEKGTMCKMARGEMVRWMAEHRVTGPDRLAEFDRLGFCFDKSRSEEQTFVFLKQPG